MKKLLIYLHFAMFIFVFPTQVLSKNVEFTVVAGGCFWCVEADFEKIPGVIEAISGFSGGHKKNPTYKEVIKGKTGHFEAVKISYDSDVIKYKDLIDIFWRTIDPTDGTGQFCDRGFSYQSAVFVKSSIEKDIAILSKLEAQKKLKDEILTPILELKNFYPADQTHQDYYKGENIIFTRYGLIKQSKAYKYYRKGCGRDLRLKELWGSDAFISN